MISFNLSCWIFCPDSAGLACSLALQNQPCLYLLASSHDPGADPETGPWGPATEHLCTTVTPFAAADSRRRGGRRRFIGRSWGALLGEVAALCWAKRRRRRRPPVARHLRGRSAAVRLRVSRLSQAGCCGCKVSLVRLGVTRRGSSWRTEISMLTQLEFEIHNWFS